MTMGRAIGVAVAALAAAGLSIPAAAYAGAGVVGEPQPGAAPFAAGFGPGGGGTGAVLPDGSTVLASTDNGSDEISVCVVPRDGHACEEPPGETITVPSTSDTFGTPFVLSTGGSDVSIVVGECCSLAPTHVLVYDSTDGGRTFGPYREAGTLDGVSAATYVDGAIVVAADLTDGSVQLQTFSPSPTTPATATASLTSGAGSDIGSDVAVSTVDGGVLVAYDLPFAAVETSDVLFAKAGSDVASAASYTQVATFQNEGILAISDGTVLTREALRPWGCAIRDFDGTSLGAPVQVPLLPQDGNPICTEAASTGAVRVFSTYRATHHFALAEQTWHGSRWTARVVATGGPDLDGFWAPVLTAAGTGLGLCQGADIVAYPILDPQAVHLRAVGAAVKTDGDADLRGSASPAAVGRAVALQRLDAGRWYPVALTHESAGGAFSFHVGVPGSEALRAVAASRAGVEELGYSNAVTIRVAK